MSSRSGRALLALGALVIAGGAAIGSGAAFTTETTNPNNTFTAGILDVAASPDGAILTASNLVPGESRSGSVTISNTGSVAGSNWQLDQDITAEAAGTDPEGLVPPAELSDTLDLTVTSGATSVYSGPISGLDTTTLTAIPAGQARTYDFTVTLPAGTGNGVEGGSLTTSYKWSASAGS